jgi:phosphoglycerate kinase
MAKASVKDLGDIQGKVVLVRQDLNVPQDKDLKITDDTRIREAIPTLKFLVDKGAKVLIATHLVRNLPGIPIPG